MRLRSNWRMSSAPTCSSFCAYCASAASREPLAQRVVGELRVALHPLVDRRLHLELGRERGWSSPAMSHCSSTDSGGTKRLTVSSISPRDHVADRVGDVVAFQQLVALLVDHAALVVGDVVVFEQLLADVEVARLDAVLRLGDRAVDDRMLDRLALGHLEPLHDRAQALAAEDAQQRILERQVEARRARVALAAGAAAQLVVDAPRLVALGADDVQAARGDHRVVAHLPFVAQRRDLRVLLARRRAPRRRAARGSAARCCRPARCRCRGPPCWWRW